MSWWGKLKDGLKKSSSKISEQLHTVFKKKKLDDDTLDMLEESMILSDFGVQSAYAIRAALYKEKFNKDVDERELRLWLAQYVENILKPYTHPLAIVKNPHVIFVMGVNGVGKTTSIAKMAQYYMQQGKTVHVAACDTFRAAATEQLAVWANRLGFKLYTQKQGHDPAALAFDAFKSSIENKADVLFIDTAGRLHNKQNLMDEMKKIVRVIQKIDPNAPHTNLMVLDATTGQNALQQIEQFKTVSNIEGLVLTKLDGTAKGGMLVAITEKFQIPINFLGVGEQADDLQPFDACQFSKQLFGIDESPQ
jgi:fused signal recognition particle receptor